MKVWIVHNFSQFDELSSHIGVTTQWEIIRKKRKIPRPNLYRGKPTASMKTTEAVWVFWEKILQQLLPCSVREWRPHDIVFRSVDTSVWVEVKTSHLDNRSVIREAQVNEYKEFFGLRNAYFASIFYKKEWTTRVPKLIYIFPLRVIIYLTNSIDKTGNRSQTAFYGLTPFKAKLLYDLLASREDIFHRREYQTSNLRENPNALLRIVDSRDSFAHILSLDPRFNS